MASGGSVWKTCLVSVVSAVLSSELQLRGLEMEGEEGTALVAASFSANILSHLDTNSSPPLIGTNTLLLLLRCIEEVRKRTVGVGGGGRQLLHTLHAMLEAALHSPPLDDGNAVEVCRTMCASGIATQHEGEGRQLLNTLRVVDQTLSSTHTCDVWECTLNALESDAAYAPCATAQLAATAARAAREGHRTFSLTHMSTRPSSTGLDDQAIELV